MELRGFATAALSCAALVLAGACGGTGGPGSGGAGGAGTGSSSTSTSTSTGSSCTCQYTALCGAGDSVGVGKFIGTGATADAACAQALADCEAFTTACPSGSMGEPPEACCDDGTPTCFIKASGAACN